MSEFKISEGLTYIIRDLKGATALLGVLGDQYESKALLSVEDNLSAHNALEDMYRNAIDALEKLRADLKED